MVTKSFMIDCFIQSNRSLKEYAAVAVDVIRSATVEVILSMSGRRCYYAPSVDSANVLARQLGNPLLVGEVGGYMPFGFDVNNSPVDVEQLIDISRPAIVVSSSGTPLLHELRKLKSVYIACLLNYSAITNYIAQHHDRVAIIGAPTRGEFREEDQLCCAWIGAGLTRFGFVPENERTAKIVDMWRKSTVEVCAIGKSAEYLRKSGQNNDLDYILSHVDNVNAIFKIKKNEIVRIQ